MALFWIILLSAFSIDAEVRAAECYYSVTISGSTTNGKKYCEKCCGDYSKQYCCTTGDTSTGLIVGAVLGGTVVLVLGLGIAICCLKNFSKRHKRVRNNNAHRSNANTIAIVHGAGTSRGDLRHFEMASRHPSPTPGAMKLSEYYQPPPGPPPVYTYPAGQRPDHLGPMPSVG